MTNEAIIILDKEIYECEIEITNHKKYIRGLQDNIDVQLDILDSKRRGLKSMKQSVALLQNPESWTEFQPVLSDAEIIPNKTVGDNGTVIEDYLKGNKSQ